MSRTLAGLSTFPKIANRRRPGRTSRKSSRRLEAVSTSWADRPVTLPPGCARLATKPVPTGSPSDNDIDLESDELSSDFAVAFVASLRPANLDCDGSVFDPAKLAQSLHKGGDPSALCRRYSAAYEPDGRELCRLLCARRKRPRRCCAAEQRDELAPLHTAPVIRSPRRRGRAR